ncbi:MAG TPA: nucleotidyltransferase family protein [Candidatus Cybelea sp.]|nr:nucleotidyltransferase family protein [Candidatus Cybelea sp.]
MLAAVILAAGESRRMGSPKALVPFRGASFLEHLLNATRHSRVGVTRVVLGSRAEEIRTKLGIDAALVVVNPGWQHGQLSSLQVALRSLPGGTEGMILCPVDHPLISGNLVAQLIEKFDSSGKLIALPTFHARRGHPVIFRTPLYDELLAVSPDVGARQVVWAHADQIVEVPTEEEGVVLNLDDPEALKKATGGG